MRLRTLLAVLVGLLLGPWAPTTSASEATYSYDVPTVARVGVHTFGVAEANPTQLTRSDRAEQSYDIGHEYATGH